MTPLKGGNNDGDETFLESHVLSILPLASFLDTPILDAPTRERGRARKYELAASRAELQDDFAIATRPCHVSGQWDHNDKGFVGISRCGVPHEFLFGHSKNARILTGIKNRT